MSLRTRLSALEASGLIRLAEVQPELEYLFRHALVQEAAYASLVKYDRKRLHLVVGEALERLYAERLDELAATLSHHFGRADAHEKALSYLVRAAERAKATYANDEAMAFYRAAIERAAVLSRSGAPSSEAWSAQSAQLHERLGDVLELSGKFEEARAAYDGALRRTPQTEHVGQARLQRKSGLAWSHQLRHQDAAEAYDLAEEMLGAEPDESATVWWQEWLRLQLNRMEMHYWQARLRELAQLVERIRPAMQQHGTPALRFYFYDSLISVAERRDRYTISDEILANARAMLAAGQESGDQRLIAEGQFQLGFCLLWHDDFDEAEEHLRLAEDLMRRIGHAFYLTHVLTYLGLLYRRRGNVDAARPYIQQTLVTGRANQMTIGIARAEANLAWLAWREAKPDEAYQHGLAAVESWSRASFADPFQWSGCLPLAAAALRNDQVAEAVRFARVMLEPTQHRLPDPIDEPLAQAVQFHEQGQPESARSCLQQALAAAERLRYL